MKEDEINEMLDDENSSVTNNKKVIKRPRMKMSDLKEMLKTQDIRIGELESKISKLEMSVSQIENDYLANVQAGEGFMKAGTEQNLDELNKDLQNKYGKVLKIITIVLFIFVVILSSITIKQFGDYRNHMNANNIAGETFDEVNMIDPGFSVASTDNYFIVLGDDDNTYIAESCEDMVCTWNNENGNVAGVSATAWYNVDMDDNFPGYGRILSDVTQ